MKPLRVVVDPNVLISLLIGKRVTAIAQIFHDARFQIITDDLLLDELDGVARRPKFRKHFPPEKVDQVVYLLEQNAEILPPATDFRRISRDPADDYLLDLCKRGKATILVTGDNDLLVLEKHGSTRILSPRQFVDEFIQP